MPRKLPFTPSAIIVLSGRALTRGPMSLRGNTVLNLSLTVKGLWRYYVLQVADPNGLLVKELIVARRGM